VYQHISVAKLTFFFFRPVPHSPRVPQAERSHRQTRYTVAAEASQSLNDADQDRVLVAMLTKKNLDEHNHQSDLCAGSEISLELRRQRFERFREAARALGINLSDQALAPMWQGLDGLTPMERFIIEMNDSFKAQGISERNRKDSQIKRE
jgi:hypothetical protein